MALLQLPKIFRSARSMEKSSSRRRKRQQKRSSALAGVFFRQSVAAVSVSETDDTTVGSYSEGADDIYTDHCHPQSLSSSSSQVSWKSTTRKSFCKNQPLIAADPDSSKDFNNFPSDSGDNEEPVVMLRQAMARELPESSWYYSSNHVMVNVARRQSMVAPLTRLAALDAMARQHAQAMADATELYHGDPQQMIETFTTTNTPTSTKSTTTERSSTSSAVSSSSSTATAPRIRIMGENVAAGDSIRAMHAKMMQTATHRINILHRGYTHFGVGTAKGTDGRLYMCQVYRG